MSVLRYCTVVQQAVRLAKPDDPNDPTSEDWFYDTGKASAALGYAIEGKEQEALELAEPLAHKYWSHMDLAEEQLRSAVHIELCVVNAPYR